MKLVTRESAHADRVACPWLIRKSFDAPGADYAHRDDQRRLELEFPFYDALYAYCGR